MKVQNEEWMWICDFIWKGYRDIAKDIGKKKKDADQPEETKTNKDERVQESYSLWWFFAYLAARKDFSSRLNPLVRAFFADNDAARRELLKECESAFAPLSATLDRTKYLGEHAPNDTQWQAICTAVDSPISFIQGPPGTGKTDTILNLVYQLWQLRKDKKPEEKMKIAIVSSNGAALKNIHKKLEDLQKEGLDQKLAAKVAQLGSHEERIKFNKKQNEISFSSVRRCYCQDEENGPVYFKDEDKEQDFSKEAWLDEHPVDKYPNATLKSVRRESTVEVEEFFKKFVAFTSTAHSLPACFKNGLLCQYDYVIVDEASQMDCLAGLMVMCYAKHLVLVGDEKQLAPVIKRETIQTGERSLFGEQADGDEDIPDVDEIEAELYETNPELFEELDEEEWADYLRECAENEAQCRLLETYLPKEDKSFLDLCLELFAPKQLEAGAPIPAQNALKVFLKEHYRCHPGIIRFCNEEVYGGELEIVRTEEGVPIKVLYFHGDYCQKCFSASEKEGTVPEDSTLSELYRVAQEDWGYQLPPDHRPHSSKANAKQVDIFMAEEWEGLKARIEERARVDKDHPLTACILSPFRGQLAALRNAIQSCDPSVPVSLDTLFASRKQAKTDVLTINVSATSVHKSQGQEFDIVYLLPVEDGDWESPFSQKKRMVNVAVSRAKEELRIITSTKYMSPEVQEKLGFRPRTQNETPAFEEDQGEKFLRLLIDYVSDAHLKGQKESPFGFHKTLLASVFDEKCLYAGPDKELDELQPPSAAQRLVTDVVKRIAEKDMDVTLHTEVPISRVLEELNKTSELEACQHSEQFKRYLNAREEKTSFDLVLYWNNIPFLAIEVDGAYHRFPLSKSMSEDEPDKTPEERYQDFRKRWLLDREKDALVREVIGGQVYQGNRKTYWDPWKAKDEDRECDQWDQPAGTFALLRLPDDGTTFLETDALRKEARQRGEKGEDLADQIFTIQDIIEKYLPAVQDEGALPAEKIAAPDQEIPPAEEDAISITAFLNTWSQEEKSWWLEAHLPKKEEKKDSQSTRANKRLKELGLLYEEGEGWRPTAKGRELGIQERKDKKYYSVYPPRVQKEIKKILLSEKKKQK